MHTTNLPFKKPIYSLGSLTAPSKIAIKLAIIDFTSNAAPISAFTIKLLKNSPDATGVDVFDLSTECSSLTSACTFVYDVAAADDYFLTIYDDSADPHINKFVQYYVV